MIGVIIVSLFFGISRFFFTGHELSLWGSWEAMAHIWVGMLLVIAWYESGENRKVAIGCLLLITLVEVVMFAVFKAR